MDTAEHDLTDKGISYIGKKNEKTPSKINKIKSARAYFREYCSNTSIHGLHYIAEKRSIAERCFWLILVALSITTCCYLISRIYRKYDQSPVIVSFATKESPIFTIPFPTVTICPMTKSDRDYFNFTQVMHDKEDNFTIASEDEIYGLHMSLVCNYGMHMFPEKKTFTEDFFETLDSIKIPFNEIFLNCKFMGDDQNCKDMFTPIIVDGSICYTFNMLDRDEIFRDNVVHFSNYHKNKMPSEWSLDTGYADHSKLDAYPWRALLSGADNALHVTLMNYNKDLDYLCIEDVQGYSVLLHNPLSIPRLKKQYFQVPLDRAVIAVVQPNMMTTSDDVKKYNPIDRECYFTWERPLKFFKIYTPDNCRLECLTNYTLKQCGCVNFFMPRQNSTPICGTGNIKCMDEAEEDLKELELMFQIFSEEEVSEYEEFSCDCMPLCTELSYNMEESQSSWEWQEQFRAARLHIEDKMHVSRLSVFFKLDEFLTSQRNELYGPTDFLANFGGLLGLFTGFSILSFIEIIYFCTLRIFCNTRLYDSWTGQEE